MRVNRTTLIHGLIAAANRERDRRRAAEQAKAEAAWQGVLDQLEEMAARLAVGPGAAADRELAEQIARAPDWARIDALRTPADRSRAEAMALCWTVDPDAAMRLLREYC